MKHMRSNIFLFVLLGSCWATSHAGLLTYNWSSNGNTANLLSGSGYFTVDMNDIVGGSAGDAIQDFYFEWQTIGGMFSVASATGAVEVFSDINFNGQEISFFNACFATPPNPNGCDILPTGSPLIFIMSNNWGASTSTSSVDRVSQSPQEFKLVSIPEPTTLALMGLGIAGLGFRRKTK